MPNKYINNPRADDDNLFRNEVKPRKNMVLPKFLPADFIQNEKELEILKWALQFYIYQEKQQKISGKVYLTEITEENKDIATQLLMRTV